MKQHIYFTYKKNTFSIPNEWHLLTSDQFLYLCGLIEKFSNGDLSAGMVKALYVCKIMNWNPFKITNKDALSNLAMLSEQITFIFNINYPNDVLESLSEQEKAIFKKVSPQSSDLTIARYLAKQKYTFTIDSCFCAQLLPEIKIGNKKIKSYSINTDFNRLTSSLTAMQYIDACELLGGEKESLPVLASILYYEGAYNSQKAHIESNKFNSLPLITLQAIALNFISFNNYILRKTPYSLLISAKSKKTGSITLGPVESLYNLSADGFGDICVVEQMNLFQYLDLCKKKTIDTIKGMNDAKIKITEIEEKTGMPINIIEEILK